MPFDWTKPEVDLLSRMWGTGPSAEAIARIITHECGRSVSRNAVISKAHRLGLQRLRGAPRGPAMRKPRARKKPRQPSTAPTADIGRHRGPVETPDPVACIEEPVIPLSERQTILVRRGGKLYANESFGDHCCRWPIGDPRNPEFHFCGRSKVPGVAYCEFHYRRALQPPKVGRKPMDVGEHVAANSNQKTPEVVS